MVTAWWTAGAAWAQAIFSVAGIGVAIWLAQRQHKENVALELNRRRSRLRAVEAIVHEASSFFKVMVRDLADPERRLNMALFLDKSPDLSRIRRTLDGIPLHELGSYGAVVVVQNLSMCANSMHYWVQRIKARENIEELLEQNDMTGHRLSFGDIEFSATCAAEQMEDIMEGRAD